MSSFKDLRIVDNFYQTSAFFPMPTILIGTLCDDHSTNLGSYSLCAPYYVAGKTYIQDQMSVNTSYSYKGHLRKHIIPTLGNIKLRSLRVIQVQEFVNLLAEKGYKRTTIKTIVNVLSAGLSQAFREEYIRFNPVGRIRFPRANVTDTSQEIKTLNKEQAIILINHFKNHHLFLPVYWALFLGLRRGEVSALKWTDVSFSTSTLTIWGMPLHR